ncbi:threonine aldolase [Pyrenophora tritici-repentis Pt-1C-BFP]|uniref:Threonine aldolase n=1 Tax=Pyrenophora tritici-repentis (strain Pt-1C-BFP) TaxID=426418 RepID=B2WCK9_PYRTR|nr:threonine aldolase [Pyrenophora tritici-repentis Pt-1C-BFP]EDU50637.1 threonine aldolase [Pyrenophora tritici-repentis Pt-1C-BFP]
MPPSPLYPLARACTKTLTAHNRAFVPPLSHPSLVPVRQLHSTRIAMSEFSQYTAKSSKSVTNGATHDGSAWGGKKNPAAFDFRSDVHTTPTRSMLKAIQECSLLDDVMMEDPTTKSLERFVSDLTGKEDALLVLSGTMGNQVALRAHLAQPPHAVLCDRRGHIINYEAGGVATLSQAMVQPLDAKNGTYLTLEDIQNLKDYCAEFDTISLCISKGLGAPIGSIIVGTKAFIKRSRWIRKSIGGGLRQAGVVAAPMRVAIEETFLGGKLTQSHENAKKIAKIWTDLGGKLQYPVDTNMVWLDLEAHEVNINNFIELGEKYGVTIRGGRLVVHYQIGEEAIEALRKVFTETLTGKESEGKLAEAPHDPEDLKLKGKGVE